ncbi:hypothetical protein ACH5RR_008927 [Cinchona calisaya]|uniref:Uncharacterized protein n=1 Tax=Cinchona calisaya TaxID=153742 RepID=A0ABD3AGN5_9GENT
MINWYLAARMVDNDTVSLVLALITWSLWLTRCQFLYHDVVPSGSRAIKTVIELLSNLSFISTLKSTPFAGILAQNLLAPVQLTQANRPRVVVLVPAVDKRSSASPNRLILERAFMLKLKLSYMG